MKLRKLNQERAKNKSKKDGCNKKLKFVILNILLFLIYHYYFKSLHPLRTISIQGWDFYLMNWWTDELPNSCKHFIRLIGLSSVHLKHPCEVTIFLKKYQGIHACLVSDFHSVLEKMSIIWKILGFHPRLKLLHVIAIYFKEEFITEPRWNVS